MSTTTLDRAKPRRTGARARRPLRPDMRVFAARAAARLKARYGNRVVADSGPLIEELRKDAAG